MGDLVRVLNWNDCNQTVIVLANVEWHELGIVTPKNVRAELFRSSRSLRSIPNSTTLALAAGCTKVVDKPVTLDEMEMLLVGLLNS